VTSTRGSHHFISGASGPPADELPAVLPTPNVIWRGDGIVVAVPSLDVYSTGIELTIMCRMSSLQSRTTDYVQATKNRLHQLTVNGHPISQNRGEYDDHGFTYAAWVPLSSDAMTDLSTLAFELDWPEVQHAQHRVQGIGRAAAKITRLWS
jgi:hypothetical protein